MVSLALDKNNNIIASDILQLCSDNECLVQDVKNRLSMLAKEYPFDTTLGIDYITLLSQNRQNDLKQAIEKELLKDSRISSVKIIQSNFIDGRLILNIEIKNTQGEVLSV